MQHRIQNDFNEYKYISASMLYLHIRQNLELVLLLKFSDETQIGVLQV